MLYRCNPPLTRPGFSLIEVIVAMAICLLGLAAILQMSNLSQSFARKTSDATTLQILCQNRVNELLAGLLPLESVNEQPCPEDPQVVFSVEVDPQEELPLALVVVTVQPAREEGGRTSRRPDEAADKVVRKRETRESQFTIRRWMAARNQPELEKELTPESTSAAPQPASPAGNLADEEDLP